VATLRKVTELAPSLPSTWYALGQDYNAIKEEALRSFESHTQGVADHSRSLISNT
jgi:hypothetical protein